MPEPGAVTSVEVARLLLRAASLAGTDARRLAADAGMPTWSMSAREGMLPAALVARLWELLEGATGDPYAGLTVARQRVLGDFSLYDYLITTSSTLRDGISAAGRYLHLLTTYSRVDAVARDARYSSYAYRCPAPGRRGDELCLQFAVASFCAGARTVTGRRVVPAHAALPLARPGSAGAFVDALGTDNVDFGAGAAVFTFRNQDLDARLPTADPLLADILARYADGLPAPPPVGWYNQFRLLLDEALDEGSPSLGKAARRLAVSPRTLQRRLAEHGTTWREELDAARKRRAKNAGLGAPDAVKLARQLRYADPRSARRALRRWSGQ